jgi:hypothetical protein
LSSEKSMQYVMLISLNYKGTLNLQTLHFIINRLCKHIFDLKVSLLAYISQFLHPLIIVVSSVILYQSSLSLYRCTFPVNSQIPSLFALKWYFHQEFQICQYYSTIIQNNSHINSVFPLIIESFTLPII